MGCVGGSVDSRKWSAGGHSARRMLLAADQQTFSTSTKGLVRACGPGGSRDGDACAWRDVVNGEGGGVRDMMHAVDARGGPCPIIVSMRAGIPCEACVFRGGGGVVWPACFCI